MKILEKILEKKMRFLQIRRYSFYDAFEYVGEKRTRGKANQNTGAPISTTF